MSKVDNFKLVESLLFDKLDTNVTTNSDKIIVGRIIRRKKENPEEKSEYIVKRYTFANKEDFVKYQDEIKKLCAMYNARFYVATSIKSMRDIAFDISEKVPNLIRHEQYYFFRRIFDDTADANLGIKEHKLWVFDVDDKSHVTPVLEYLVKSGLMLTHFAGMVPTINGSHILMKPHDIRYIHDNKVNALSEDGSLRLCDVVDVKKNALTLVYYSDEETLTE